jgi:hypothetical protein
MIFLKSGGSRHSDLVKAALHYERLRLSLYDNAQTRSTLEFIVDKPVRSGISVVRKIRAVQRSIALTIHKGHFPMKDESSHTYAAATSIAAAMVVLGMAALTLSLPAAASVGLDCGDCHTSAQGGGPLTPLGEKFKANGDKMPK